ncbi:hypothetical protein ACT4US_36655, partial [Bacillus sp. HC-Mk]
FLQMIERTKSQILAAPEEAFTLRNASEDPAKWNYVSSCWEFDATPEQFQVWVKKFYELMAELNEITKGAKLGTANNEMVADESIKEKGIDIGDTIIDPVSKKEFTIVGFTKDQMFSHTPVVYVNEDVWGSISQPN